MESTKMGITQKISFVVAALAIAFFLLSVVAAFAEPPGITSSQPPSVKPFAQYCAPAGRIQALAGLVYGEKLMARGISGDGSMVELFLSKERTFTVVKTSTKGVSCAVDVGSDMELVLEFPGQKL